jgi:hypothetical protein
MDIFLFPQQIKLSPSAVEHATIKNEYVKYIGAKFLTQFEVSHINMHSFPNVTDYIEIEFTLKRRYSNYIAATYLPSVCLLLAAEITLFIDESHFEATTMVALTSMLVMYTLYQSSAASLPQTSYLKMIDVWLLPGLLLPFVVFLLEVKQIHH